MHMGVNKNCPWRLARQIRPGSSVDPPRDIGYHEAKSSRMPSGSLKTGTPSLIDTPGAWAVVIQNDRRA